MSSNRKKARISLSKKIERDMELMAKEERKRIRYEALSQRENKKA